MKKKKLLVLTTVLSLALAAGTYGFVSKSGLVKASNTSLVTDENGNNYIVTSSDEFIVGTEVVISANIPENDKFSTYQYIIDGPSYDRLTTRSDNSATWTPITKGNYTIILEVTDSLGEVTEYSLPVKVKNPKKDFKVNGITITPLMFDVIVKGTSTVMNVSVEGGSEEYEFEYGYIKEDGSDFIMGKTSQNSYYLQTPYIGDITYYVVVKDIEEGTTERYEMERHIYGCEITGVDTNVASPAIVGDEIKFTINTKYETNYRDYNTYIIDVIDNETNESVFYNRVQRFNLDDLKWTPEKAGSYTVKAGISTIENSSSYEFNFDVVDKKNNQVTIYYRGFENPYIHYTADGKNWTDVPGIKMDTCDYLNYTHVASINIGNSDKLTCCFNDGNNNWDSNYEKNYTFKPGKYTFVNGEINEIKDNSDDKIVIYYKGYDTPYIHYAIRGTWTSVPGVKMDTCNEVSGYTHKVEIEVLDNESMTCCFNDGNGNWDNNNGNDFVLEKGVYYYNDGKISKNK